MSFDSVTFWIFFALAWAIWRWAPFGAAKGIALLLSLFFYAWWNPWYVPLIATSAVVDYLAGARIHAATERGARRRWLAVSLACNLGLLAVFKYTPFAVETVHGIGSWLGLEQDFRLARWIIPVGISFYTFQTLSYSLDIYRRQLVPAGSFRDFFLYVAFFPQLVAGPIVRARELLPQFQRRRRLLPAAVQEGAYCVIKGLFLKIVVADNLALAVGAVFDLEALARHSPATVWLGVVFFSCQVYADFCGYSLIAIGLAYLMGLRFPPNFNYPFLSRGLFEFWSRWHITLAHWFRDYLFLPLALKVSRRGASRIYLALVITMAASGLWHGASWTFVLWGTLHGLGFCFEQILRRGGSWSQRTSRPAGAAGYASALGQMAATHFFWLTTLVFFRAESLEMALALLERMFVAPFSGDGPEGVRFARFAVLVLPVVLLHLVQLAHEWYGVRKGPYARALAAAVYLLLLTVVSRDTSLDFVYFQF